MLGTMRIIQTLFSRKNGHKSDKFTDIYVCHMHTEEWNVYYLFLNTEKNLQI